MEIGKGDVVKGGAISTAKFVLSSAPAATAGFIVGYLVPNIPDPVYCLVTFGLVGYTLKKITDYGLEVNFKTFEQPEPYIEVNPKLTVAQQAMQLGCRYMNGMVVTKATELFLDYYGPGALAKAFKSLLPVIPIIVDQTLEALRMGAYICKPITKKILADRLDIPKISIYH